jgi:hypothetical protein
MAFGITPAFAQFSSNLQGGVQDATKAVIPGAVVVPTNTATAVSQTVTPGAHGDFRFVSLAPGDYKVTASAKDLRSTK